jgi:hypothetical protein
LDGNDLTPNPDDIPLAAAAAKPYVPFDADDIYTQGWIDKGLPYPPPGKKYSRNGKLVAGHLKPFIKASDGTYRGIPAPLKKQREEAVAKAEAEGAVKGETVKPSMAYMRVSQLPWQLIERMGEKSEFPMSWGYGKEGVYVYAAKQILLSPKSATVQEINARLEGPVTQKTEMTYGPNADLAKLLARVRPPAAAIREDRPPLPALEAEIVK